LGPVETRLGIKKIQVALLPGVSQALGRVKADHGQEPLVKAAAGMGRSGDSAAANQESTPTLHLKVGIGAGENRTR